MKFVPRHKQIIGRVVIKRVLSKILRPDETKNTTKMILVDAVGPEVTDIKVGDVVLPLKIGGINLDGGACFRPFADDESVGFFVREVNPKTDLFVQVENGSEYVALDADSAAKSLGAPPEKSSSEEAA